MQGPLQPGLDQEIGPVVDPHQLHRIGTAGGVQRRQEGLRGHPVDADLPVPVGLPEELHHVAGEVEGRGLSREQDAVDVRIVPLGDHHDVGPQAVGHAGDAPGQAQGEDGPRVEREGEEQDHEDETKAPPGLPANVLSRELEGRQAHLNGPGPRSRGSGRRRSPTRGRTRGRSPPAWSLYGRPCPRPCRARTPSPSPPCPR